MFEQPKRVYAVLVPCMVAFFLLSSLGSDKTPSDGGMYYFAVTFWILFCVTLLAIVAYSVTLGVRRLRHRTA